MQDMMYNMGAKSGKGKGAGGSGDAARGGRNGRFSWKGALYQAWDMNVGNMKLDICSIKLADLQTKGDCRLRVMCKKEVRPPGCSKSEGGSCRETWGSAPAGRLPSPSLAMYLSLSPYVYI